MKPVVRLLVAAPLAVVPSFLAAQRVPTSPAYAAQQRAQAVVQASLAAHGGEARIRASKGVAIAFDGTRHMVHQSMKVAPPWQEQPSRWRYLVDFAGQRTRTERESYYPADFAFIGRSATTPQGGWWVDPTRAGKGDAVARQPAQPFQPLRNALTRDVPPLLLLRAADRTATLRSLGRATLDGRPADVVSYSESDGGVQWTLYVDAATRLLRAYDLVRPDAVLGDQVMTVSFAGWDTTAGIVLPTRRTERHNGTLIQEGRLTIALDPAVHDSLFAPPATGWLAEAKPDSLESLPVRELAPNVWLLQQLPGGNRVLLVAFADFTMAFETPTPQLAADAVIREAARLAPGKPLRYVTFSHPHDDHAGGLRPYVARGITILTLPQHVPFVQAIVGTKHRLSPDSLQRAPRAARIETWTGKRVIEDATMRVELLDVGPNSHVDGMMLAWLPQHRLLFQGDMIIASPTGELSPANALTRDFARAIDALKLDVMTIVGVHGRVVTIEELRANIAKSASASR